MDENGRDAAATMKTTLLSNFLQSFAQRLEADPYRGGDTAYRASTRK